MMRRFCRCRELHVRTVLVFMSDVACQSARISGETCVMPDVRYVMKYEVVCNAECCCCVLVSLGRVVATVVLYTVHTLEQDAMHHYLPLLRSPPHTQQPPERLISQRSDES